MVAVVVTRLMCIFFGFGPWLRALAPYIGCGPKLRQHADWFTYMTSSELSNYILLRAINVLLHGGLVYIAIVVPTSIVLAIATICCFRYYNNKKRKRFEEDWQYRWSKSH